MSEKVKEQKIKEKVEIKRGKHNRRSEVKYSHTLHKERNEISPDADGRVSQQLKRPQIQNN